MLYQGPTQFLHQKYLIGSPKNKDNIELASDPQNKI